jgi:hypothetical protein
MERKGRGMVLHYHGICRNGVQNTMETSSNRGLPIRSSGQKRYRMNRDQWGNMCDKALPADQGMISARNATDAHAQDSFRKTKCCYPS